MPIHSINILQKLSLENIAKDICKNLEYKNINQIRNNLEHMEEKLDQGWEQSKDKMDDVFRYSVNWFAHDFSSLTDNTLKIGNDYLKLTPDSLAYLYSYYDNLTSIIFQKYIRPVKDEVDKFWEQFERNQ